MSLKNCLLKIKEKVKINRRGRILKKFEFLINEIDYSQERFISKFMEKENQILDKKFEKLNGDIISILDSMEEKFVEKNNNIIEKISNLKLEHKISKNEIFSLLEVIVKKIDLIEDSNYIFQKNIKELLDKNFIVIRDGIINSEEKINLIIAENQNFLKNQIKSIQEIEENKINNINQLLSSIITNVNIINNNTQFFIEECNNIVECNSKSILLSIEEVKTLMKIMSVNNLLDEIQIKR